VFDESDAAIRRRRTGCWVNPQTLLLQIFSQLRRRSPDREPSVQTVLYQPRPLRIGRTFNTREKGAWLADQNDHTLPRQQLKR
jgi:hypothetical protein